MKFIPSLIIGALLFIAPIHSNSQGNHCGSDEYMAKLLESNPELLKSLTNYNEELSVLNSSQPKQYKKGVTRTIPVVFHIIHTYGSENITKAQIEDQMRILNEDFQRLNKDTSATRSQFKSIAADMDLEFKLARIDPDGNCTEGITRTYSTLTDGGDDANKALIRWDYRKYLNIWVVKNIVYNTSSTGRVLGYATLPQFTNSTTDGIVILSDYIGSIGTASNSGNNGRVLTHEIGHWLGLYHPFQNGCGGNCSNSGDYVCDTPPVAEPSFGCSKSANTCSNDFPNDNLDMTENFMDYANGNCQNMFTNGQKAVVENSLSRSNYRAQNIAPSTHTATGIFTNPTCKAIADFSTSNNIFTICEGGSVSFKDYTYNGAVSTYAWSFDGGTPAASSVASPSIVYNKAGVYKVSLNVTNGSGTTTKTVDKMIQVVPSKSNITTPVSEGFEDGNVLLKWKSLEEGNYGWKRVTNAKFEGTASMKANIDNGTAANFLYNLVSEPYDLTTIKGQQPKLSYRVAYRPSVTTSTEILTVSVSKDCGQSWVVLKAYSNANGLGVDKVAEPGWVPSQQSDWAVLTNDLVNYENISNLMVRFEVRSRSGNSVYLDNVNIYAESPAALKPLNPIDLGIKVYPNPSQGIVNISIRNNGSKFDGIQLYDATGRILEVEKPIIAKDGEAVSCQFSHLNPGLYFAHISVDGQIVRTKFLITQK